MRKLIFLMVVAVAALAVVPLTMAQDSTSMDDFAALASYFPADFIGFAAFRTDEGIVDELDAYYAQIAQFFPRILPADFSLRSLYSLPLGPNITFDEIRPWLGDAAALGFAGSMEDMMTASRTPLLALVQITDRDLAEAFFDDLLLQDGFYEKFTQGDFTVYISSSSFVNEVLAVGDDVLVYTADKTGVPAESLTDNLANSDSYTASVGLLPENDYDAFLYIDTAAIQRGTMTSLNQFSAGSQQPPSMVAMMELMEAAYSALGPQAVGISILDNRSIVIDASQVMGDSSQMEALGFVTSSETAPIDLSFAANVPADAPFVVQSTGVGPAVQMGINNVRTLGDFLSDRGVIQDLLAQSYYRPEESALIAHIMNPNSLITFGELSFAGMTGLNLEKDVLAWMNGDFAAYLRVLPSERLGITLDAGVVGQTSDADAALNTINKLGEAFDQYRLTYERTDDILSLSAPLRVFFPSQMREQAANAPELDFLVGVNGDVFAMGSRPAVEYSLNPSGDSLADDASFQAAQAYFLPDAQVLMYLNFKPLVPVLRPRVNLGQEEIIILNLFDSISITGTAADEGSVARMVFTLSEEPPTLR